MNSNYRVVSSSPQAYSGCKSFEISFLCHLKTLTRHLKTLFVYPLSSSDIIRSYNMVGSQAVVYLKAVCRFSNHLSDWIEQISYQLEDVRCIHLVGGGWGGPQGLKVSGRNRWPEQSAQHAVMMALQELICNLPLLALGFEEEKFTAMELHYGNNTIFAD